MSPFRLASLVALAGCAAQGGGRPSTSPRLSELAPRRIGVLVAGEDPVDARVKIDRFGLRYPDPIEPDTELPAQGERARVISTLLADRLVARLRAQGYDADIVAPSRTVAEALDPTRHEAVLVVLYRAAEAWPVSEYEGSHREERAHEVLVRHDYTFTVERGLLILPTAYLLHTTSTLRLWSRTQLGGPPPERVEYANPVRKLGVSLEPGEKPAFPDLARRAADVVIASYFDGFPRPALPRAAAINPYAFVDEAATDRFRHAGRWLVEAGAAFAHRPFATSIPVTDDRPAATLDAAPGAAAVEIALRRLGPRWLHGPSLLLGRGVASVERGGIGTDKPKSGLLSDDRLVARTLAVDSPLVIEGGYTVSRAWMPRSRLLLALGGGLTIAGLIADRERDGVSIGNDARLSFAPVAQAEALVRLGHWLLGPYARGGIALDTDGDTDLALTAGLRGGWAL